MADHLGDRAFYLVHLKPCGPAESARPDELGVHHGQELLGFAGLDQVIIGTQPLAQHDVFLLAARGQEDERDEDPGGIGTYVLVELKAIHARHHHIGDDQLRRHFGDGLQPGPAIRCNGYLMPDRLQHIPDGVGHYGIVLDNQDARHSSPRADQRSHMPSKITAILTTAKSVNQFTWRIEPSPFWALACRSSITKVPMPILQKLVVVALDYLVDSSLDKGSLT